MWLDIIISKILHNLMNLEHFGNPYLRSSDNSSSLLISVTPLYDTKFHAGLLYKVYPSAAPLVQSFATTLSRIAYFYYHRFDK